MKPTPEEIAERYIREVMEMEDMQEGCARVSGVRPNWCCQWNSRALCSECEYLQSGMVKVIADAIREALAIERQTDGV